MQKKRYRNKQQSELAILQAAADLFCSQGVNDTTTRQIAKKAGRAEGLICRYFKGKLGLAEAITKRATELKMPDLAPIPDIAGLNLKIYIDENTTAENLPVVIYLSNRVAAALKSEFQIK